MWPERNLILHVVDHIGFQDATILKGKTTHDVWYEFIECCTLIYIGYQSIIELDQEAWLAAESFRDLANADGIILQISGAQSHNSIGSGDRYHVPLRRVFRVVITRRKNLDLETLLRYVIKGLSYTMGTNGLVPSLLVFGTLPTFLMENKKLMNQSGRMKAITTAR